jgi:hypothetical protein
MLEDERLSTKLLQLKSRIVNALLKKMNASEQLRKRRGRNWRQKLENSKKRRMKRELQYSALTQPPVCQQGTVDLTLPLESNLQGRQRLSQPVERQMVDGVREWLRREERLCLLLLHQRETEQAARGQVQLEGLTEQALQERAEPGVNKLFVEN